MTTPKNNKGGVKEVTTPKNTNAKSNNEKTINPVKTEIVPAPKQEEKEAPKPQPQPKTLEEQINHFLGLEKLMNIKRKLNTHLEKVSALTIEDEELKKFETGNKYGVRIELHDDERNEYSITNPRLVKELQEHLIKLIEEKIEDYNTQIINFNSTAA